MIRYSVKEIRTAGVECKWGRLSNGGPAIFGRAHTGAWVVIDAKMWKDAGIVGILEAFQNHTTLIEFFSVRA